MDRKVLEESVFISLKNFLIRTIDDYFQDMEKELSVEYEEMDHDLFEEMFYRDYLTPFLEKYYYPIIDKLSSLDLSNIRSELWEDFPVYGLGNYTFSLEGTKANIDFSYFSINYCNHYNLKGCNITNVDKVNILDFDAFDKEVIDNNFDVFLDEDYPLEFRKKYYMHNLEIGDFLGLDKDKREKFPDNIDVFYPSNLYKGLKSIRRVNELLELYNEEMTFFLTNINTIYNINMTDFVENFSNIKNEEFRDKFYEYLREQIMHNYRSFSLDDLPREFILENSDILLLDSDFPQDIKEKYYTSTLLWEDIIKYPKLLDYVENNKFLVSYSIENYWFVEILDSPYIHELFDEHKEFLCYYLDEKNRNYLYGLKEHLMDKDTHFSDWLKGTVKDDNRRLEMYIIYAHNDSTVYPDDISLEEMIKRRDLRSSDENQLLDELINYLGYDNIIRFQEETGFFTSKKYNNPLFNLEFIGSIIKQRNNKNYYDIFFEKDDYESFTDSICKVFSFNMSGRVVFDYRDVSDVFKKKHLDIFLTEDELISLDEEDKQYVLDAFYLGKMRFGDIKKYPILKEVLKDKDLTIPFQEKMYGYKIIPNFLELCYIYGDYLESVYLTLSNKMIISFEEACKVIEEAIYDSIIDGRLKKYGEDLPDTFKKKYPYLFLPKDAPLELKEKFYNRELKIEDFEKEELLKYLTDNKVDLAAGMDSLFSKLIGIKDEVSVEDNLKKIKIIKDYGNIPSEEEELQDEYISIIKDKYDEVDDMFLKTFRDVLERIINSNSSKLYRIRSKIIVPIVRSGDPLTKLGEIEDLYLKNHLPDVFKTYQVFRILHSDSNNRLVLNINGNSSPVLKSHSTRSNELIISSDLVKVAMESNNSSIRDYIHSIEDGYKLYKDYKEGRKLKEEELGKLKYFSKMLLALYNESILGKEKRVDSSGDIIKDIEKGISLLSVNGDVNYDLVDRLTKMFTYFAGFNHYSELLAHMDMEKDEADRRNRERVKYPFKLHRGDLIKGIKSKKYLLPSIHNGIVATEFLGSDASDNGDLTPLDTDFSYCLDDDELDDGIRHSISNNYGPVWLIIENNDRDIEISRGIEDDYEKGDFHRDKIELFKTIEEGHFGIRTGVGSAHISYIVTSEYDPNMGLDVAMGGFYIPIVDRSGKVLFSVEDYDEIRKKMSGLSHYGIDSYNFSDNLKTLEIEEIALKLEEDRRRVRDTGKKIKDAFRESLEEIEVDGEKINFKLKDYMDGDLAIGSIEVIDIGSTSRGTSMIGDTDFDYMFRIDSNIYKDSRKKKAIVDRVGSVLKVLPNGNDEFREKGVSIDGISGLVDIDISFERKRDDISYTTDMCLKDRLDTIKEIDEEKYNLVLANIICAKKVLKDAGCYYKHGHSKSTENGGLGGVGVENWILQNGGSFIDAAQSFVDSAYNEERNGFIDWESFKNKYQVWDFGENFHGREGIHDNFIYDNMDANGYKVMLSTLVKELEKHKRKDLIIEMLEEDDNSFTNNGSIIVK